MVNMDNMINEKYYNDDKLHTITFAISNTINPTFKVWATHLQSALEELVEYLVKEQWIGLYYTLDELDELDLDENELESYHAIDGEHYLDMNRIYCEVAK